MNGFISNPDVQRRLAAGDRQLDLVELADLEWLMQDPRGRRLAYRVVFLLAGLETESTHYLPSGDVSPLLTAHNEGRRWVGRTFLDEVQRHFPGEFLLMLEERLRTQQAVDARTRHIVASAASETEG